MRHVGTCRRLARTGRIAPELLKHRAAPASALAAIFVALYSGGNARGEVYVPIFGGPISVFSDTGSPINTTLIPTVTAPRGIAVSGTDIYVTDSNDSSVAKYTTSGATVSTALITGLTNPECIAVSGNFVFVTYNGGTVGEFTTSGAVVNPTLITGSGFMEGIVVSGAHLFVASPGLGSDNGTVGEYTLGPTPGTIAASNPTFLSALPEPEGLAMSGSDLFVACLFGPVGKYTLDDSGALVSSVPSLITGLPAFTDYIAASGTDLYIGNSSPGVISKYSTSGALEDASLVPNVPFLEGVAVEDSVPEPGSLALLGLGAVGLLSRRRGR